MRLWVNCLAFAVFVIGGSGCITARPFTVNIEVEITHFGDPYTGSAEELSFSPDGHYLAVYTERGNEIDSKVEDSLRFYRTSDIDRVFNSKTDTSPPSPVWSVTLQTKAEDSIITKWRWLLDSTGVAFLRAEEGGYKRLMIADMRSMNVGPLSDDMEAVQEFDIRDREHFVYAVTKEGQASEELSKRRHQLDLGAGHSIYDLIFPGEQWEETRVPSQCNLRVVNRERRVTIVYNSGPAVIDGDCSASLAPDGNSVITNQIVGNVPPRWEQQYAPPFPESAYRIRAGARDAQSGLAYPTREYVRIDVGSGTATPLTDTPAASAAGWFTPNTSSWSRDGRYALLTGAFLNDARRIEMPSFPCVSVVNVFTRNAECVVSLQMAPARGYGGGFRYVLAAQFIRGDAQQVRVTFLNPVGHLYEASDFQRVRPGVWRAVRRGAAKNAHTYGGVEIFVQQGLDERPRLVGRKSGIVRVLWDPNPQLADVELGSASVYTWTDDKGLMRKGVLYKPPTYRNGQRYPLVIQTHGVAEAEFRPSGMYPTAFAARALAAVGIVVLQVDEAQCPQVTPEEGRCAAEAYESAVLQLASEGLIDPTSVGIIGFSRTCFYVMQALISGSIHYKAASITDGVMQSFTQFLFSIDAHQGITEDAIAVVGASPYGSGLKDWLERSPEFKLDRVQSPLLVVAIGRPHVMLMWEPYAGLRYLGKPVELQVLNSTAHVLRNPATRMASQGGTIDWFRFWLKNEEDPNPAKVPQYTRWRGLRNNQNGNTVPAQHFSRQ